MKKLSVFQIVLLAVFGSLAVAGVLVFSLGASSAGNKNQIGPVIIWGTLPQSAFTAVIQQLAQDDHNLSQVTYVQKPADSFDQQLSDALSSGTGPDLFVMPVDEVIKDSNKVVAIPYTQGSKVQFQNTFVQAANPYLGPSGVLGVPFVMDPLVLYWNQDLLASGGFASPPSTWQQVATMTKQLTQKNQTGEITQAGIAMGTYQNITDAKQILSALIMQAGGDIVGPNSQGALTPLLYVGNAQNATPPAVSALAFYTEFADPSQPDYAWNNSLPNARSAFAAGQVAMYIGYASDASVIQSMNPNLNFAIAALPQLKSTSVDTGQVYAFAIPRVSKNQAGAELAAFTLASASSSAALAGALGMPSTRRDVLSQPAQGYEDLFNKMAIITKTWYDPDPLQTAPIFQGMIENTISGATQPDAAVQTANQQLLQLTDSVNGTNTSSGS